MDRNGFEGFFDSFLFLTILGIASCIVFSSSPALLGSEESAVRDVAVRYAATSLDAILSSSLPGASYAGRDGGSLKLANDTTIEEFLLYETYLLSMGWSLTSFDDWNGLINGLTRWLIAPAYEFTLKTVVPLGDGKLTMVSIGDGEASLGYGACRFFTVNGVSIEMSLLLRWA